jgi:hypothetical protein
MGKTLSLLSILVVLCGILAAPLYLFWPNDFDAALALDGVLLFVFVCIWALAVQVINETEPQVCIPNSVLRAADMVLNIARAVFIITISASILLVIIFTKPLLYVAGTIIAAAVVLAVLVYGTEHMFKQKV